MAANKRENERIALEIIERSPSIALRVTGDTGAWLTKFITKNIEVYGYTKEEFLSGKIAWNDIVHPEDLPTLCEKLDSNAAQGIDSFTELYRILTKDGRAVWVSDSNTVTRNAQGGILCSDCVISDYTALKETQEKIQDNFRRQSVLNDILQGLHDNDFDRSLQIILDRTGAYLDISRVVLFQDALDGTECSAVYEWCNTGIEPMMKNKEFKLNYKTDIPEIAQDLATLGCRVVNYGGVPTGSAQEFEREKVTSSAMFVVHQVDKRYGFICFDECEKTRVWEQDTIHFLENISKLVSTALMRRENELAVQRMTYSDQLTGLVNRFSFDMHMEKAIENASRVKQQGYVLFIDMDDFKVINEGYGHDYGDAMLVEIAHYFRKEFSDISKLFRFGGDEFVVLIEPSPFSKQDNEKKVQEIIHNILSRAQHPWKVLGRQFYCTISIGVVQYPNGAASVKEVMKNADIAMYQAKKQGKNSYVVYNPNMDNNSIERAEMEHRMREAIDNNFDGFAVHYQPLVDRVGHIVGAEALMRWVDTDGGLMLPGQFIPLAEYLGLIVPLGEFVLRTAAMECKRINNVLPDFTMSINVSVRQFQQQDFILNVRKILTESGVDFRNIVLEVTEGMMIQDMQNMHKLLTDLRKMGIKVAMDDFGTGYSSLNSMREIPLDIIKIDRSFIQDVTTDAYSKSFIRLITDLGHSMDREVCVEGVETEEQYHYCVACGANSIQGYYFWRPMEAKSFRSLLLGDDLFSGLSKERPL